MDDFKKRDKYNLFENLIHAFIDRKQLPSPGMTLFFFTSMSILFGVLIYSLQIIRPQLYLPIPMISVPFAFIILFAPFYSRKTYILMMIYLYLIIVGVSFFTGGFFPSTIVGLIIIIVLTTVTEIIHRAIDFRTDALTALEDQRKILDAVMYSAEALLKTEKWQNTIQLILSRFGETIHVTHLLIFRDESEEREHFMHALYEWHDQRYASQLANPLVQRVPYERANIPWRESLAYNKEIEKYEDQVSEVDKSLFKLDHISYLAAVPIFSDDNFWGFILLIDAQAKTSIKVSPLRVIRTLARILGQSVTRQIIGNKIQQHNEELERINNLMVNREVKMVSLKKELEEKSHGKQ